MRDLHRQSIRLRGYSYTQPGYYFLTICTQNRAKLFDSSVGADPCVCPSQSQKLISTWWAKIPSKFPNIALDAFVIMPDHIHGIIQITGQNTAQSQPIPGGHAGPPLHEIVKWFKTMTTNDYIHGVKTGAFPSFDHRLWQRNYWERVIRDEQELRNVRQYIADNPLGLPLPKLPHF